MVIRFWKNVCPIGIYLNKGAWFSPAYDCKSDKIILVHIDNIIDIKRTGESKNTYKLGRMVT